MEFTFYWGISDNKIKGVLCEMVLRTAEKKGRRRIGNRRRLPFELEVAREDFLEKMTFKPKTGKK